jgi:DNA repair protein RecO (recombination protein O)
MLLKTRGIILHHTRYGENSAIITIYTEQWGTKAFILQKSKKKENKSALLQGLTMVELVAYYKEQRAVQRISEIRAQPVLTHLQTNIQKSSISLFLTELLYRSLKEENGNPDLFNFIHHSIQILDHLSTSVSQFHLFFMIQLSKHLGFYPNGICEKNTPYFNLLDGIYTASNTPEEYVIPNHLAEYLFNLSYSTFQNFHKIKADAELRWELLHVLVKYFEIHHTHGKRIQSHFVLKEVLHA